MYAWGALIFSYFLFWCGGGSLVLGRMRNRPGLGCRVRMGTRRYKRRCIYCAGYGWGLGNTNGGSFVVQGTDGDSATQTAVSLLIRRYYCSGVGATKSQRAMLIADAVSLRLLQLTLRLAVPPEINLLPAVA